MRTRSVGWVVVLASLACASGSGRGGSSATELLRKAGGSETNPPGGGPEYFVVDTVRGTAQRTFNAVRFTYDSLGIAFSYYDPDRLELGGFIPDLKELDGEPPSRWIDCGEGVVASNNADRYAISLTLGTRVLRLDSLTSRVETVVRARSRQRDVWSSLTRCATRGTLEARIVDGAEALLRRYGAGARGRTP